MRWTGWTSCSRTRRSDAGVKRAIASASPSSAARLRVHKSPGQVRCLPGLECCAPRGNRTPNPLIKRSLRLGIDTRARRRTSARGVATCRSLAGVVGVTLGSGCPKLASPDSQFGRSVRGTLASAVKAWIDGRRVSVVDPV
jgi:hypothetical protein